MATVVSIDPGLAYCGLAAVDTDGTAHKLISLDVCVTSKCDEKRPAPWLRDDRVHRAREIREWLTRCLQLYAPAAIVIEDFGFLQQAYSTACLAMAYQSIIDAIDQCNRAHPVPLVSASANVWRNELVGPLDAPRQRTVKVSMSNEQKLAAKKADREVNRKMTKEREKRAHAEALRRVQGAQAQLSLMPVTKSVHTLDALGLFCWGVTTAPVKGAIYGRAS